MRKYRFDHSIIGGTFDHFHIGHQYFIDQTFKISQLVTIGITTNEFIQSKNSLNNKESYKVRRKNLLSFLQERKYLLRVEIFPLRDIYGTAGTDKTLQAIVVTSNTYPNALKVNLLRNKSGLRKLKIIKINLKKSHDKKTISSTRIRQGEIDREGIIYRYMYNSAVKLFLPEKLREHLRQPQGTVFVGDEMNFSTAAKKIIDFITKTRPSMVISVGDIISQSLEKNGFVSDIQIIDLKTQRHRFQSSPKWQTVSARVNQAGTISKRASEALRKMIEVYFKKNSKQTLRIRGEEDLLALVAILHAPLGAIVIYGQQSLGAVCILVTESRKKYAAELLKQFST